jgi:hypothetical protein
MERTLVLYGTITLTNDVIDSCFVTGIHKESGIESKTYPTEFNENNTCVYTINTNDATWLRANTTHADIDINKNDTLSLNLEVYGKSGCLYLKTVDIKILESITEHPVVNRNIIIDTPDKVLHGKGNN